MRIALFQMKSGIDRQENCASLVLAIEAAAAGKAVMLFTPEMSNIIDRDRARSAAQLSTEDDDEGLCLIRAAAAKFGLWVHVGSMAFLKAAGSPERVNRGLVIDDHGCIRARYDKIHLFDVDLPTGESWRESSIYAAGADGVVVQTPVGMLGLSICYDIRFPTLYQALSGSGAVVLAIPAAFTVPTGKAHWHTLTQARAIENAAWVIAAAQSGVHEDGRETFGHSLVIDPWGQIVLDMANRHGLAFAEIDHDVTTATRAQMPVLSHRRAIDKVRVLA
jgi:deaminated glutathione amidase